MLPQNPMQLLPAYHQRLDEAKFLPWYRAQFTNARRAYGHWMAGGCQQDDGVYHQMIARDAGGKAVRYDHSSRPDVHASISVDTFAHTYHRNTGSFSICFAGFGDATTTDLGSETVTPDEVRLYIATLADDCIDLHMPVGNFMSHGEAADNLDFLTRSDPDAPHDPYGPSTTCERWDLCCLVDPVTLALHPGFVARDGLLRLPDYIRGEAILRIQELTRAKWAA